MTVNKLLQHQNAHTLDFSADKWFVYTTPNATTNILPGLLHIYGTKTAKTNFTKKQNYKKKLCRLEWRSTD